MKETTMKKSEQLKEKAEMVDDINPLTHYREDFYVFTESELQERDTEIAREQRQACQDFAILTSRGMLMTSILDTPLVTDKP